MLKLETDPEFIDQIAGRVAEIVQPKLSAKLAIAVQYPPMLDYKDIMRFFSCKDKKAFQIMNIIPTVEGVGSHKVPIWKLLDWIDENIETVKHLFPEYSGYGISKDI